MKSLKGALLGLLLLPTLALAETRVAIVDMEGVIRASEQANTLREKLRQEFAADELALRKLSDEGNALKEKLAKEGDFLNSTDRDALLTQVKGKYEEFQQLNGRLKQAMQERERDFLEELRPQVEVILQQLVEQEKIDVILNRRSVIYANPDLDLSPKVLDLLNKQ